MQSNFVSRKLTSPVWEYKRQPMNIFKGIFILVLAPAVPVAVGALLGVLYGLGRGV